MALPAIHLVKRSKRSYAMRSGTDSTASEFEIQQVLNEVVLLTVCKSQVHACVVVIDDRIQIGKAPIVIEAAFRMG